MTGQEAIERIHSVYPNGKKEGLSGIRALMMRLGNAHAAVPAVHVAGTNGKGSCCAMIERMLRAAGYKTGLYTSPYIEVYNERIRIDGVPISDERLAALVERVWPAVEACEKEGVHITEFELGTALAFCAFAQERVDVAVIEVGLGGRLDATNIITPLVSVITEVGMDHMDILGGTIGEIALEKAGIIKRGVPVSLGAQEKAAYGVLLAAARGLNAPVIDPDAENVRESPDDITFDVSLEGERINGLRVSLRGRHQAENACAALGAVQALRREGFAIPQSAVRAGLAAVRWPGRLERFGRVLLDGAHNDPGARAVRLCGQVAAAREHRAADRDDGRQGDGQDGRAAAHARLPRGLHDAERPPRDGRAPARGNIRPARRSGRGRARPRAGARARPRAGRAEGDRARGGLAVSDRRAARDAAAGKGVFGCHLSTSASC